MTNRAAITLVFVSLFLARPMFAQTTVSREAASIQQVGQAIEDYEYLNRGQTITSWTKFKEFYSFDKAFHDFGATQTFLEDHYQFITQTLALPNMGSPCDGCRVLLLRTTPQEHMIGSGDRYQERYLLCRLSNGRISFESVHEPDIQAMLKKAGVTIIPKDGLPAVDTDPNEVSPWVYGIVILSIAAVAGFLSKRNSKAPVTAPS